MSILTEKNIDNPRRILGTGEVVIGITLVIIGSMQLFMNNVRINLSFSTNPTFLEDLWAIILVLMCFTVGLIYTGLGINNIVYQSTNIPNLKVGTSFETLKPRNYQLKISYTPSGLWILISIIALFVWRSNYNESSLFGWNSFYTPFFILILISSISFVLLAMLLPKVQTPKWVSMTQDICSGHPQKLYRILKDGLIKLGYDQNRFEENDHEELRNIGVQDTGTTRGHTFMEAYPKIINSENRKMATFSLVWAGFFTIIGFFLIVINPFALPMPIIGFVSVFIGYDFLRKSNKLFKIMIFESKIIFSEIKGEYYKSDLGVGKSLDDSLSSHRISIISDYRLTHYCANVLSGCIASHKYREIIAMYVSKDIENDVKSFVEFVDYNRKSDLEVQGIDFRQESTRRLLQGNLAMARIKKGNDQIDQEYEKKKQQLGEDEIVFCPQCGIKRKDSANFCPRCGTKF